MRQQTNILLESGTNEVELIELIVAGQSFGINVAKIREIIQFKPENIRHPPTSHRSVVGILDYRVGTPLLIDLSQHLFNEPCEGQVVVVAEVNGVTAAFVVEEVDRIYRLTWEEIQPLPSQLVDPDTPISGSVQVEGRDMLLLDLENVLGEIIPGSQLAASMIKEPSIAEGRSRHEVKLVFCDDSRFLRDILVRALTIAGYQLKSVCEDGQAAWEELLKIKAKAQSEGRPLTHYVDALISDIEMPRLDGLTLCKQVKDDPFLHDLPVMMYSSLINPQMGKKCESVGADAYAAKPDVSKLLEFVDRLCLSRAD